ncbi:hypothetical protein Nepgr_000582 [Nepenthes gracilis]|uniref:Uncharacterized protein n=1 Tax=Nepenthes gracilis TaxID=150966 RepID=A0AAD3RWZ6_NEPGR|nr:hypothetical protein Nepgr_000582 [Nepenthes gracilis]
MHLAVCRRCHQISTILPSVSPGLLLAVKKSIDSIAPQSQMDLETENRIASVLLKEAAELRRQAEKEGVLAYLRQPNVRGRPNSRFLTATVLGIQQANRAVEVNEMWRVRQKELELDKRCKGRSSCESSSHTSRLKDDGESSRSTSSGHAGYLKDGRSECFSGKKVKEECYFREDEGLKDEEVEEFLQSRVKRGRGAIGSRMDETGPYLCHFSGDQDSLFAGSDPVRKNRLFGPEKPPSWKPFQSSEDEQDDQCQKKHSSGSSKKEHSKKKNKVKEKSRDKKRKREHGKRHTH